MDKYFSVNAFKFLIFFNLLTFNKRVLNLAGSLARSESHLLCVVIGCSPLMSHIHFIKPNDTENMSGCKTTCCPIKLIIQKQYYLSIVQQYIVHVTC